MITVEFNGIIKMDEDSGDWYAEDKEGKILNADFLTGIDNYLESLGHDFTCNNEEIEITIKINR